LKNNITTGSICDVERRASVTTEVASFSSPQSWSYWSRVQFPVGALCVLFFTTAYRQALGPTQPPIQWK